MFSFQLGKSGSGGGERRRRRLQGTCLKSVEMCRNVLSFQSATADLRLGAGADHTENVVVKYRSVIVIFKVAAFGCIDPVFERIIGVGFGRKAGGNEKWELKGTKGPRDKGWGKRRKVEAGHGGQARRHDGNSNDRDFYFQSPRACYAL
jgi:hypothetical protein